MTGRKLATQEIGILLHLLRVGDGRMPTALLKGGRERATTLWRLGLVEVWHRQSLATGRLEGPFYSLTWNGRERATQLFLSRQSRAHLSNGYQPASPRPAGDVPPPPNLEESADANP